MPSKTRKSMWLNVDGSVVHLDFAKDVSKVSDKDIEELKDFIRFLRDASGKGSTGLVKAYKKVYGKKERRRGK